MAYATGTATNYLNLMDKVKAHVTGGAMGSQAWTVLRDRTNTDNTRELIFRAPGLAGQNQIYMGMKSFFSVGGDYYNWILDGFIGYDNNASFEQQPGGLGSWVQPTGLEYDTLPYPPQLPMWNQPMTYWLAANGRRMVMVVKVSTRYEAMYLGLLKPYGAPGQLSYPMVVGGSMTGRQTLRTSQTMNVINYKYSTDHPDHSHFVNPGHSDTYLESDSASEKVCGSLRYRNPNGQWNGTANYMSDGKVYDHGFGPASRYCNTWPYMGANKYPDGTRTHPLRGMLPNLDGTYPLFPILLIDAVPKQIVGELDDVYWLPGASNSPESIVTIGSDQYFVTCNVARVNNEDFWCFKMA